MEIKLLEWKARGDFSGCEVGRAEKAIEGLEWLSSASALLDNNDWEQIGSSNGLVYPEILQIFKVDGQDLWVIVDATGWDGHQQVPDRFVAAFSSYEEAAYYRSLRLRWSDPKRVLDVAAEVVSGAPVDRLAEVIDWRDLPR